jgi:hypothetical protein
MCDIKGNSMMTKKRYYEIERRLQEILEEEKVGEVISILKEVMRFDPGCSTYDKVKEKLEKKKAEGISTYEALNQRAYYTKNKPDINRKRYEQLKQRKQAKEKATSTHEV